MAILTGEFSKCPNCGDDSLERVVGSDLCKSHCHVCGYEEK